MKPEQMALDLRYDPALGRADFIEGAGNVRALQAIGHWREWSGRALLVVGAPASGKSHLAQIWAESARAPVVSADALNEALLPHLQQGFRLCLEDVDRKLQDETALFHLFNLLRARGEALLLTARQWPSEWTIRLPDLASRVRAVPVVEIEEPDEHFLQSLLVKLFADRRLEVPPEVISYLALRMERSPGFAHALVEAVDREALAARARVTRPLVRRVLQRLMPADPVR